jgi:hypothetical protein
MKTIESIIETKRMIIIFDSLGVIKNIVRTSLISERVEADIFWFGRQSLGFGAPREGLHRGSQIYRQHQSEHVYLRLGALQFLAELAYLRVLQLHAVDKVRDVLN